MRAVDDLVEVIGLRAAILLTRRFSRRPLYIPRSFPETHPILLAVGYEAAVKLGEAYGGEQVIVPDELHALRLLRDQAIRDAYTAAGEDDKHASINRIAYEFGVSRKWVHVVLEREGIGRRYGGQHDPRQTTLGEGF